MAEIGWDRKKTVLRWTAHRMVAVQRQFVRFFSFFKPSLIAEGAISALIVVIVLIGVVWNMPDSAIKRALLPALAPVALGTGLEQSWSMYAPDPPRRLENLEVHVTMANGDDRVWTLTPHDRIIGPVVTHRWRKLKESLTGDASIRPDFAHWVVRELTGLSDKPVRVYMLLRTEFLPAPGASGPGPTGTELLYDENLSGLP